LSVSLIPVSDLSPYRLSLSPAMLNLHVNLRIFLFPTPSML
jgi:hypothetical protein